MTRTARRPRLSEAVFDFWGDAIRRGRLEQAGRKRPRYKRRQARPGTPVKAEPSPDAGNRCHTRPESGRPSDA